MTDEEAQTFDFFAEARRINDGWVREYAPGELNDEIWSNVDDLHQLGTSTRAISPSDSTSLIPRWVGGGASSHSALDAEKRLEQKLSLDSADEVLGDIEELFKRDLTTMPLKDAERLRRANVVSVEQALPGYWRCRALRQFLRGFKYSIWVQTVWLVLLSSAF